MSLVDMMETKYGFSFTNRHGYCYAVPASAELAAALSVRTNSPVLKIDYIFCDRNGMPLMVDMMQLSGSFRLALDAAEEHHWLIEYHIKKDRIKAVFFDMDRQK